MSSCVGPIYVYLGSQLSSLFSTWAAWTTWPLKQVENENPKAVNGSRHLVKQPTLKANVIFRYKELQDATGLFNKKNLIGVGGFAKVCSSILSSISLLIKSHASKVFIGIFSFSPSAFVMFCMFFPRSVRCR